MSNSDEIIIKNIDHLGIVAGLSDDSFNSLCNHLYFNLKYGMWDPTGISENDLKLNHQGLAVWQIEEILRKGAEVTVRTIRRCLSQMTEFLMIGRKKHPNHQRAFLYYLDKEDNQPETTPNKVRLTDQEETQTTTKTSSEVTQINLSLDKSETKEMLTREFKYDFIGVKQLNKQSFLDRFKDYIPEQWVREVFDEMVESGHFIETDKIIKQSKKQKPKFKKGDRVLYQNRYGVIDRLEGVGSWYVSFNDSYLFEAVKESELEIYQP